MTFFRAFISLWSAPQNVVDTAAAWCSRVAWCSTLGRKQEVGRFNFLVAVCMIVAPADLKLVAGGARPTQETCAEIVCSGLRDCEIRKRVKSQWTKHAKVNGRSMPGCGIELTSGSTATKSGNLESSKRT